MLDHMAVAGGSWLGAVRWLNVTPATRRKLRGERPCSLDHFLAPGLAATLKHSPKAIKINRLVLLPIGFFDELLERLFLHVISQEDTQIFQRDRTRCVAVKAIERIL